MGRTANLFQFCVRASSVTQSYPNPARLLCPWGSPGKNTGVGCHFLVHGIFLTQVSNLGLRRLWH